MKTCYMKHCLLACIIPVFLLIATTSFSNSCNEIPVIFVSQGRSWYLKHTLWQARQYNRRVILISDDPRNKYDLDIEYHDVAPYKQDVDRITAPYATLTVSRSFFTSIQRWFIIRNFMEMNNIDVCFHSDCDVMLYTNVTEESKKFEPFDLVVVCDPYRTASPEFRRYGTSNSCYVKAKNVIF